MKTLTELATQIVSRRRQLGLKQADMLMKIGMSQQQYQRIESGGDTRVSTFLRVLEGLNMSIMIVPRDKVASIEPLLAEDGDQLNEDTETDSWSSLLKGLEDE